ncbi:hypothetical protein ACTPEO_05410 [Clostridioides difficile]
MLNEEAREKILNLPADTNKRFEDIENLKEVSNIPYVTDTCEYTIENSKKGYLTNFSIEGKTLVNIIDKITYNRNVNTGKHFMKVSYNLKKFTIKNYSNLGIYIAIHNSNNVWVRDIFIAGENLSYIELLDGEIISGIQGIVSNGWSEEDADKFKSSCIIIEGNYTTKDISYFEGLQSVGQGDKIEILSTKLNTSNLIKSDYIYTKGKCNRFSGEYLDTDDKHYACEEFMQIKGNTEYVFYGLNGNRQYYDSNKNFIQGISSPEQHFQLTRNSSWRYWVEKTPSNAHFIKVTLHIDNLINGKAILFEGNKFDKKIIPYTLRSLPNGTKDEIVYKDNSYKLIQKCEEIILNGQEVWSELTENTTNETLLFSVPIGASTNGTNNIDLHCDKFKASVIWGTDYNFEGIYETKTNIWIRIFKNRLTTQNVEGFKAWLDSNNVTVIRQIKTKEIELGTLNLEKFNNQTRFICNSGAITPNLNFESTQNLGSHIEVIRDNIKNISNIQINTEILDLSNILVNGWIPRSSLNPQEFGCIFNKIGRIVYVNMRVYSGLVDKNTVILKLPNILMPKHFVVFKVFDSAGSALVGNMYIDIINGCIKIGEALSSNKDIIIMGHYYLD